MTIDTTKSTESKSTESRSIRAALARLAILQTQYCVKHPDSQADKCVSRAADPHALITFLSQSQGGDEREKRNSVSTLLGSRKAAHFRSAIQPRLILLQPLLAACQVLPTTINPGQWSAHGNTDGNIDFTPDEQSQVLGPAGFKLHTLNGCGCTIIEALVSVPERNDADWLHDAVDGYTNQLKMSRYALPVNLMHGLAGSVCAGLIDNILQYAYAPIERVQDKRAARAGLNSDLNDLLDICDILALQNPEYAIRFAEDYRKNAVFDRARHLLERYLTSSQSNSAATKLLARVLHESWDFSNAITVFERAIALDPSDWTLYRDRGLCFLGVMRYDDAGDSLKIAQRKNPNDVEISDDLQRTALLRQWQTTANDDKTMPALAICDSEHRRKRLQYDSLALAEYLFRKHGTLTIHNAFDPTILEHCRRQFSADYEHYLNDINHPDALRIGHRRIQINIALHGAFNNPEFYANPFVLSIMQRLIGRKVIIGSTVCAVSLPGAREQHWHKDHRALFTRDEFDTPIDIPPVAITVMIPLVPLDEVIGSTAVKKTSHKLASPESEELETQVPIAPLGSCFLMDLSLTHRGLGNQSSTIRPVVNMVYQQFWFTDNKNFKNHPPLRINPEEFENIPTKHRRLFDWSIQPGPKVNCSATT